jgi:hypothetical protein
MAHIERRRVRRPDGFGRVRVVTRYRVRYRDESGRQHCETKMRLVDAERRKAEIDVALAGATWRDPRRGEMRLNEWVEQWLPTRHDLRATTRARLETTMQTGSTALRQRAASGDHQRQSPTVGLRPVGQRSLRRDNPESCLRASPVLGCRDRRQSSAVQSRDCSASSDGAPKASALSVAGRG